ncbi:MAG: type III secretion system chaperone [Desulfobacterales bacterium]|nr:type III secretion system chaperone [Desulfobacterales bacterium]MBF0396846.1 type III secretion system chaperone [Desulfobacterales bacterium]
MSNYKNLIDKFFDLIEYKDKDFDVKEPVPLTFEDKYYITIQEKKDDVLIAGSFEITNEIEMINKENFYKTLLHFNYGSLFSHKISISLSPNSEDAVVLTLFIPIMALTEQDLYNNVIFVFEQAKKLYEIVSKIDSGKKNEDNNKINPTMMV